jgi:hypothetical protein
MTNVTDTPPAVVIERGKARMVLALASLNVIRSLGELEAIAMAMARALDGDASPAKSRSKSGTRAVCALCAH